MSNKPIYLPGLNGIRALAALAVVISHITVSLKEFSLDPYIFGTSADGQPQGLLLASHGVSIFFVLSGFLITYLLLAEKDVQAISIKKFYIRRILRIWPLYYLFLAACLMVILLLGSRINLATLVMDLFFAANIPFVLGMSLPFLGHYWSLGVEEQFYIFWPWLVKKTSRLLPVTILLTVALILLKLAVHFRYPSSTLEYFLMITRYQCMLIGAIGAMLYKAEHTLFLRIADNKLVQCLSWGVLFLVAINLFRVIAILDYEIVSVAALFIIIGQVRLRNRLINLEVPVLNFLGKISYGIYIIHPLVLYFFQQILGRLDIYTPAKYTLVYISIVATTIFIAHLSYTYFELYFLRLKKKFEVVKSSPSKISG